MFRCVPIFTLLCFIYGYSALYADELKENKSGIYESSGLSASAQGGFIHQMDADLDSGGSFSVNRFFVQTSPTYSYGNFNSISLSLGYGFDSYDFSGETGLGARGPWDDVHSFRVSLPWRWKINENWMGFVSPTLRYSAMDGADFDDALTGGGVAAFSYRYNDRLSVGGGFAVMTQLEDDTQVIPILIIDWKITDTWSLQTLQGTGAAPGPGLTLSWQPNERWLVSFGGRYEELRFRLSESGAVPGGIGEDRSFPVFTGIEYRINPKASIFFMGGIEVGGELSLEDREGRTLVEEEHDPAGFLGVSFSASF